MSDGRKKVFQVKIKPLQGGKELVLPDASLDGDVYRQAAPNGRIGQAGFTIPDFYLRVPNYAESPELAEELNELDRLFCSQGEEAYFSLEQTECDPDNPTKPGRTVRSEKAHLTSCPITHGSSDCVTYTVAVTGLSLNDSKISR